MKTQTQLIINHLQAGKTLTQKQVYREPFYCTRLAARIYDIRADGVEVGVDIIKRRSKRSGRPIAYAQYFMEGEK